MKRFPVRGFRWLMLTLYALLFLGFLSLCLFSNDDEFNVTMPLLLLLSLATQFIFIFGAGTRSLCKPIQKRKLIGPVFVASGMVTLLMISFYFGMDELLNLKTGYSTGFWSFFILVWIGWYVIFFLDVQNLGRFRALKRMSKCILSGSLLELLASIPAHIIVSRRPGCLVGVQTMISVIGGILVALWVFGPGLVLFFLKAEYERQRKDPQAKQARPFKQFSLAGLMITVVFASSLLTSIYLKWSSSTNLGTGPLAWITIISGIILITHLFLKLAKWEAGNALDAK